MTELQEAEFNILKEFISVCDKLHLTYYLVCGSALGAVKYHGFIPWDDDLDIALPRQDYETFCEKGQQLLPDHLFLQNHRTEKIYPRIYSKIRNSNTTYIEKSVSDLEINHGVYIDVFPLDGYPKEAKDVASLERKKRALKALLIGSFLPNEQYSLKAKMAWVAERILGMHRHTQKILQKLERLISEWETEDSDLICNHGNWQGKLEYAPKWHYGKGTMAKFEGLDVRIPENYDAYLTQKYGDWRADLPKEQQVGHHYYTVMDLNRPYTEYIKK